MEDWNGVMSKRSSGLSCGRSTRDNDVEDFEEEDIWDSVKGIDQDSSLSPRMRKKLIFSSSSSWLNGSSTTAPRMIPKRANTTSKATNEAKGGAVVQQSSAPMEVPDWSKIYGKNGKTFSWANNGFDHDHHAYGDDVDEDEDDDDMVPPHEWIARKLARSQICSSSVCEGKGRTLKGRDLSNVRNAILTKTGFLE
ncbi:Senescence regulator [Trema orientale]|uniref:Senescence regulator n=1 Tax=Trema orientale TaxID=63057 RepID=A0A2P5EER2_TREOI|nr:Senescence regulator [Trema orientale]